MELKELINSIKADRVSVEILAGYLGYDLRKNPVDPDSDWRIMFSNRVTSDNYGVIAAIPLKELTPETNTVGIRKLYQQVTELREDFGSSFSVAVVAFLGKKRMVFFPMSGGNRDTRLDMNLETIEKDLYRDNFDFLKNENLKIESDDMFGFNSGSIPEVSDKIFRKELTSHFLSVVAFYRKKLSELITGSSLKTSMYTLLSDKAKVYLHRNQLGDLVQQESYTSVLSTVVDTIILRQLMRRFLEGYYGAQSFEVDGIALGVGSGTMDEAIQDTVEVANNMGEEAEINKLNRNSKIIDRQMDLFSDVFDQEELDKTSEVTIEDENKSRIARLSQESLKQFELAYDGDLFAGSISDVANIIEKRIASEFPEVMAKLWVDTASGNYSFRYEDMPPEALEKQYEESMSKNVQIRINDESGKPEVFYGDDKQEQKSKGAFYTDQRFVNYMVDQTVEVEFMRRYEAIKVALGTDDNRKIEKSMCYLLDLKVADFTAGGGSFLRGAFLKLAEQYKLLTTLPIPELLKEKYPQFKSDVDGQYEWENYVLTHMIYGIDIDYKAIIISSLTLTLSSLEHRPKNFQLPQLIGRTLIHQNSLINAVPYYKREKIFGKYKEEIAELIRLKKSNFDKFDKKRRELQTKLIPEAGDVAKFAEILHVESVEINLPEVFFNVDGTLKVHGGMDIIIGNPPWETWKPNSDEFFSAYDANYLKLKTKEKKLFQKALVARFPVVSDKWKQERERIRMGSVYFRNSEVFHYQGWQVNGRKTSSDMNLYKISLERFMQLGTNKLVSSILVPDNLITDAGATGIRHLLFDHYHVKEYLSFENRKGIFPSVHRSYKFALLSLDCEEPKTEKFDAFFYKDELESLQQSGEKISYPMSLIKKYEPEKLSTFEVKNQAEFDLYVKIRNKYPALEETKLLKFGNDFHKTNDAEKFVEMNEQVIPLFEGKYINQFKLTSLDNIPNGVAAGDVLSKVGKDYLSYRIAFRGVARSTDERTLIATLLPEGATGTHSLSIQKNATDMLLEQKLFYIGFLNSFTLDYIVRKLVDKNLSLSYLKQIPLPKESDVEDNLEIVQIVKELLKENNGYYDDLDEIVPGNLFIGKGHMELISELNARIMLDFDLSRKEVVTLMATFESAKHVKSVRNITQMIINDYDRLKGETEYGPEI